MSDAMARLRSFEDGFTERKAQGAASAPEVRKTLVAFANSVSDGRIAILFIGITDTGIVSGVTSPDSLQRTIVRIAREDCYPSLTVQIEVLHVEDKAILAVSVPSSANRPHFAGPAYIRIGSESRAASAEQFQELIDRRSGKVHEILKWKNQIVTVIAVGKKLGDDRLQIDKNYRATHDCQVVACDSHTLRLMVVSADRYISEPLKNVTVSHDEERHRPKLLIQAG